MTKTFNLSVPPIPNCKMRVIVMVPTLQVPQEGCEHSPNEFVYGTGTVTGTQEAHAGVSCSHPDRERSDQSDSSMASGNSQGKQVGREPSRQKSAHASDYRHEKQP